MFIMVGGTGRVGSAVVETLLAERQPVTIVTRSASKGDVWKKRGAAVAVLDVHDVDSLRTVFRSGRRAFLLNHLLIRPQTQMPRNAPPFDACWTRSRIQDWKKWWLSPPTARDPVNAAGT